MKTTIKEEAITLDKQKLTLSTSIKKILMLTNQEDTSPDHHMLANRLDNSNIKVDLELLDNPLMLELLVNLQTKETQ